MIPTQLISKPNQIIRQTLSHVALNCLNMSDSKSVTIHIKIPTTAITNTTGPNTNTRKQDRIKFHIIVSLLLNYTLI